MAGAIIGALRGILSLESAAFESGAKRGIAAMGNVERRMTRMGAAVEGAGRRMALGLTLPMAGAAAVAVKGSLQIVDAQAKVAQSLGTTVKSMQVLERAADLSGVSMGEVNQATLQLTKRLSEAVEGSGAAVKALDRLHLSAVDLQKLPLDERIAQIQDALARYVPEAERAAVASDLFGSRAGLIFTRIDSATLRLATEDVTRFGVAVSEVDADQIEVTNDAISRLGLVGRGLANQFTVGVAPFLETVANKAAGAAEWFTGLSDRTKELTATGAALVAVVGPAAVGLGLILKVGAPLVGAMAALASPVGLVVAGFTALAVAGSALAGSVSGSVSFAEAHEIAMDNVTISMGDQINATARLADALRSGGPATLATIKAKMAEAEARRAVIAQLVRERQEKELEALGYFRVLDSMAEYQAQLAALRTPGDDLEDMPAKLRAAYEAAEQGLAAAIAEQQRLLEGVRAQTHLTDAERANMEQIEANLAELQRRWNELNGITAENVSLTDRGAVAAHGLALGLSDAAGQAAAVRSYLSGLPGALAGAQANIAGLKAGIAVLSAGGGEMAANVAQYRAQLVATLPPLNDMADGQRRAIEEGLNQQVQLYEQQQALSEQYRAQVQALNAVKSAGGSASKSALAGLQKELAQRRELIGLTEQQRKKLEAVRLVQQRLGAEAAKLTKGQIDQLAEQVLELDRVDDAMTRVKDMQRQWSEQITRTAFEGGSLLDTIKGLLRDIAYQFAHTKLVLPVVASVTGVLGLDQLLVGGGTQVAGGGLTGGLGLLGNAGSLLGLGGSGIAGGISSGLGGVLSGGGLSSSFANLGGLVTGASAGWGAIGAALPAFGLIAGGLYALSRAFSRKYAGSGIRGSFGADGFEGSSIDFYKGGAFRSNSTVYKPLEAELEAAIDAQMTGLTDGLRDMAGALNLGTDAIEGFTSEQFTLWTNGKSAEEIQQLLQEQIEATGNEMAELVLGTDRFSRAGEEALDTLTRLASGLAAVNDVADLLGHDGFAASLAGGDHASDLVDQFGGIDGLVAASSTYLAAFYSDAEQSETALRRLRAEFDELGVAMPESREGFRELVEGIDLTTSGGRELYAGLLQMAGAMDQVLPQVSRFTAEISGLVSDIGGEIGAQIDAAREKQRAEAATATAWFRAAGALRDFVDGLAGSDLSGASRAQESAAHRSRFQSAIDEARGGDLDAAGQVPALARAYLQSVRETAQDNLAYRRIAAQVQGQVNQIAGIADLEGANDEVLQGLYQQQIEVLTSLANFLSLEGLTDAQVGELSDGVQALHDDWDGTVAAFEASLGALEDAITTAEAFSYDDLVGALDVAVTLDDDAPRWLRRLVERAETGIQTTLDFIIRRDDLSAADRWIATNALSHHIASLDLVLRQDLDDDTRSLALRSQAQIRRNLRLHLGQDLDADTRTMVLTRAANLSRRLNVALTRGGANTLDRLNQLQNLIGGQGSGQLTFAGGVQLTADAVFSDLSAATSGLQQPMNRLGDMLAQLRAAVDADRATRVAQANIMALQMRAARVEDRVDGSRDRGAALIGKIEALEASTGIQLLLNGSDAVLRQRQDGTIAYRASATTGGAGLAAFNAGFRGADGLEAQIAAFNARIIGQTDKLADINAQIAALQNLPQLAAAQTGKSAWQVPDSPPLAVAKSSAGDGGSTEAVQMLTRQVVAQGQFLKMVVDRIATRLELWDEDGMPEVRA